VPDSRIPSLRGLRQAGGLATALVGLAECAQVGRTKNVNCGWISGKNALVMAFQGFDKGSVQTLVPQILAAMMQT
jgi:hypothetical protein